MTGASVKTPRDTPEITLVGAGLAGSLLAIFLARRGHRVTLLERRLDPRKTGAVGGALHQPGARQSRHRGARRGRRDGERPVRAHSDGREDASRRGGTAPADSLRQQAARGHLLGFARGPERAPPGCRRIDRQSLDPLRRDGQRRRFREPPGAAAERHPTTSSSGRTEAPRRFAPRSWNGRADGSTRSRSATGTRSSRSPRRPAADSGWRRTPCTSGREANTC